MNRLTSGGLINRKKTLHFTFNGKQYLGYEGDTLASALLANGVNILARSFKYHRPRGVFGLGAEEPNAILQVGEGANTLPNQKATQVALYDGLVAKSVNGFPCVNYDLYAGLGLFSKMLSAGFYYKTFMWPKSAWDFYEEQIRKSAGLGLSPTEADPDKYEHKNVHCEVLIVGAGPAGIAAALAAAKSGQRVILVDEQEQIGGQLLTLRQKLDGKPALEWVAEQHKQLAALDNVRVLTRTTAFGKYDHNFVGLLERNTDHLGVGVEGIRQTVWHVRAQKVILATGGQERGIPFANNDRPGVMLASACSGYINRYAVKLGKAGVVFTNNDSAYQTAIDMANAGMEVKAVIDVRHNGAGTIAKEVRALGIAVYKGYAVTNTFGRKRLNKIHIEKVNLKGDKLVGGKEEIEADVLAISGGFSPVIHLHSHAGGKNEWNDDKVCFVPTNNLANEFFVGSLTGEDSLSTCIEQGYAIGYEATEQAGEAKLPNILEHTTNPLQPYWQTPYEKGAARSGKQFVDYQNDTCVSDINQAIGEGFRSIEHVKRYTALGFGTDQGKTGNINGMAIAAAKLGLTIPEVGTTTFRPAYTPVTFGAMAGSEIGELFDPIRKTAMHEWHVENGAEFEMVGQWLRPWYYPQAGETLHEAVARECLAVRNSVGMLDASTLGKIEIKGKDAAEFLNRVYTNAWLKLGVGKCRYGLMLKEDGMVMDDGVTARLGENHFYMHTTTGGAANVLNWLERWHQTEWPQLEVYMTSVTDQWATTAVVGPNSRAVVEKCIDGIDFSNEAFPFMEFRDGTLSGTPVRVMRISFSGELAFEVNINANYGRFAWQAIKAAGNEFNITPYGTETMHVLRAEKGYIIVGQDTDGSMNPYDLDMGWNVAKKKPMFIGDRSLKREDMLRDNRKQLVGLKPTDANKVLPEGAQLVNSIHFDTPADMQGHVTSSYYSAALGHSFALAVVKGGINRKGEKIYSPQADGSVIEAEICSPIFYDVDGERRDG